MEALVQDRFRDEMQAQNLNPISQPQIIELNLMDGPAAALPCRV